MKRILIIFLSLVTMVSSLTAFAEEHENILPDASAYAADISSSSIDASLYLDYSAGIDAGVYQWVLSEDGLYYTLCSVDENGTPITMTESAINVGANNAESIDLGKEAGMGGPGGFDRGNAPDGAHGSKDGVGGKGRGGMMDGAGTVYQGVYINANITNVQYQTMLVYVPAAYFTTDEAGRVTGIDRDAVIGSYTAATAPIVFLNECGGWRSSQPKSCDTSYIQQGMIYVTCGARSRDAMDENGLPSGKAPTQLVDLKSGVIQLRANADVIPGNTDRIISVGTSGGGQMSSAFGASGNMSEYYPYMLEAGVLGVAQNADGTYTSVYPDNIYAAQCYCPIADIENADLAYAWWWVDLVDDGGTLGTFTAFDVRLQELEAEAFIDYINGLALTDTEGHALTLTGLRSGSYYDTVLNNVSEALNAMVAAGQIDPASAYPEAGSWLTQDEAGAWHVTNLRGFMIGTGLVRQRNKAVPGFDTMDKSAENNAFGTVNDTAVHYSATVASILQTHYDELSVLDGFNQAQVDDYIADALTGENAAFIATQTNLLNATEIMLGNNGLAAVDPAAYWRVRSGTADQHTSFSVGFNICLAAQSMGMEADYHLVWNMGHSSNEGTSTGTFIDWINEICRE